MKTKLIFLLIAAYMNAFLLEEVQSAITDGSIFIYGTITTIDDEVYTGQIRWGKEEAFWFDHFNSSKPENDNLKYLTRDELDELENRDRKWYHGGWNWGSYSSNTHSFACEFGDIKAIYPQRGKRLLLVMRNGEELRLDGGSNDIGATVRINDNELGVLKMDWDRIELIEFMAAPTDLESAYGEPLYGSVETTSGTYVGYLQWDHDERLTDDELNGDTKNGGLDIPFGNIESIEQTFRGSKVVMKSGRIFDLSGSNDVDDDNRGIIVNIPDMGRVDIPWEEFNKITFEPAPVSSRVSYSSYHNCKPITGSVASITGDEISGRVVYDLDECLNLEILNGEKDGIEYSIPFRYIKSIKPKNREESLVKLTNGKKILLSDSVDINEENDGLLVFMTEDDYEYVPWSEVEEIKITDR